MNFRFPPLLSRLFLGVVGLSTGPAQTQVDLEYQACKQWAQLLPWIAAETTWPADAAAETNSGFVFGVFGPDKLMGAFDGMKAAPIKGRVVIVKPCHDLLEVQQCHLVFFSIIEQDKFAKIVEKLKGTGVLTVGDWQAFDKEGGILTFGLKDNRKSKGQVKASLNLAAVKEAKLTMSGELISTLQEGR